MSYASVSIHHNNLDHSSEVEVYVSMLVQSEKQATKKVHS